MNKTEIIQDGLSHCPEFNVFTTDEKKILAGIGELHEFSGGDEVFTIKHKGEYFSNKKTRTVIRGSFLLSGTGPTTRR